MQQFTEEDLFDWNDDGFVDVVAAKFEVLEKTAESLNERLRASLEEGACLTDELIRKREENKRLRKCCEEAMADRYELVSAIKSIGELRRSSETMREMRRQMQQTYAAAREDLKRRHQMALEEKAAKLVELKAARECHEKEQSRLCEVLAVRKREGEENFANTTRMQEAIAEATEERQQLLRELNAAALPLRKKESMQFERLEAAERRAIYDGLLEKMKAAEKRKQELLVYPDARRKIQVVHPARNHAPPVPHSRMLLSELIATADSTRSPKRAVL